MTSHVTRAGETQPRPDLELGLLATSARPAARDGLAASLTTDKEGPDALLGGQCMINAYRANGRASLLATTLIAFESSPPVRTQKPIDCNVDSTTGLTAVDDHPAPRHRTSRASSLGTAYSANGPRLQVTLGSERHDATEGYPCGLGAEQVSLNAVNCPEQQHTEKPSEDDDTGSPL